MGKECPDYKAFKVVRGVDRDKYKRNGGGVIESIAE